MYYNNTSVIAQILTLSYIWVDAIRPELLAKTIQKFWLLAVQQPFLYLNLIMQQKQTTSPLTLVLDLGSHACRIALFTTDGELHYINSSKISTRTTGNLHFEQDASEILAAFQWLLDQLTTQQIKHIECCGICTQRSSIVAWHRQSGEVLSPVISWRDLRNQAVMERLQAHSESIRNISGLQLSAHYSASKIQWLLHNQPELQPAMLENQLCIAPLASFLLFHLLQQKNYLIDHSNAQRTQLFDIHNLDWSASMLKLFNIDQQLLPNCVPVMYDYGRLKKLDIPVTAVCGDQNAALHAYPDICVNSALINIGTGAFMLTPASEIQQRERLLRSIASSTSEHVEYITEGTVNRAATAIDWALQQETPPLPETQLFQILPDWLKNHHSQCLFINSIAGLGSPWWCQGGEAEFINCDETSTADRYVSIIESIVFLIFNNIQQLATPIKTFYLSGGLSQLDGLCQKLSDLSGSDIIRHKQIEASALGCSRLALQHLGYTRNAFSLTIDRQFTACENTHILNRYSHFVGELEKRCRKD